MSPAERCTWLQSALLARVLVREGGRIEKAACVDGGKSERGKRTGGEGDLLTQLKADIKLTPVDQPKVHVLLHTAAPGTPHLCLV